MAYNLPVAATGLNFAGMTVQQLHHSLAASEPPAGANVYVQSLWYDAKGDWEKSHSLIQDVNNDAAAWIHAYLHRKEGDLSNADYWYRRAGRKRPDLSLHAEWEQLAEALL